MDRTKIYNVLLFFVVSQLAFAQVDIAQKKKCEISEPLVTHIYTADPSAHVFDGKLYIYPSHDVTKRLKRLIK